MEALSNSFWQNWDVVTGAARFLHFNAVCWLTSDHMPNFAQVSENFYRGGQPRLPGLQTLADKGIKHLICLRVVDANTPLVTQAKLSLTTTLLQFDVDNFNQAEAEAAAKTLIQLVKEEEGPFFLHCYYGCERTGVLAAIYQMVILDHDKDEVIEAIEQDPNFHKERHPELIPFLRGLDIEALKALETADAGARAGAGRRN